MASSIPLLFTVTAGFAVTELSASGVRQWPVLADRPVAYYRLGEAPGCMVAVDLSANAHDGVPEGTSRLTVLEWDVPFAIEAWVQLIDDYHWETGADNSYGLGIFTLWNDDLSEAQGVPGDAAMPTHELSPARAEASHEVEKVFETGALTSALGLALILFGLSPRRWRSPLRFRGSDAGLSRGSIFQVGRGNLRKRSESELNSFSARYATIAAPAVASLFHPPRSHPYAETQFRSRLDPEVRRSLAAGHQ
jgi:hypothetical protein